MPAAWLQLRKVGDICIQQQAQLDARLKNVFNCSLSSLSSNDLAYAELSAQTLPPLSVTAVKSALATTSPLLVLLQCGAEAYVQGFPHSTCLKLSTRYAIYLLTEVKRLEKKMKLINFDECTNTALFISLYKCAWVIRSLLQRTQTVTHVRGLRVIIELMLDEVTQSFRAYGTTAQSIPPLEQVNPKAYVVDDPFNSMSQEHHSSRAPPVSNHIQQTVCCLLLPHEDHD